MLTGVNPDVLAELGRVRELLAQARGATAQAGRHVESARASHRRAKQEEDELAARAARLEDELWHGPDRHPLLAAIEANGARRDPPDDDGGFHHWREHDTEPPVDYDHTIAAAVEQAEAARADGRPPAPDEAAIAAAARRAVANDPILQEGIREAVEIIRAAAPDPPPPAPAEAPPEVPPAWGMPCKLGMRLAMSDGKALSVTAEYDGRTDPAHLAFRGPVSETGYRSSVIRPYEDALAVPLPDFARGMARHLARLEGLDVLDDDGAPAWRKLPLSSLGSLPEKERRALVKAGLLNLGDVADEDLYFNGGEVTGPSPRRRQISGAAWGRAAAALGFYLAARPAAPQPDPSPLATDHLPLATPPKETVRAARARRKAERHAAGRPVRASGAEALAELDAARPEVLDRGRARAAESAAPPPRPTELFISPPAGGWDESSAREAIGRIQGRGAGAKTVVCRRPECRKARHVSVAPCLCGEIAWDGITDVVAGEDFVAQLRAGRAGPPESAPPPAVAETAPDGAPIVPPEPGDSWEGLEGWREATEAEWLAAAPMDRHEHLRLVRERPSMPARAPEEWRSEDLDKRLREAMGWLAAGARLKDQARAGRAPTAAEILDEIGHAWENAAHIAKHADGYRVRGGRAPAFWMGCDTSRPPTFEAAALVERVRRVLGLPLPSATVVLGPAAPPRSGAYTPDGPATAKKRKRKEAAHAPPT